MKVYFAPQSRAVRTVWLLEEIGVDYELVRFSLGQKEMRSPEYTKVNPNGRVPTVVDGNVVITESTAIAQYWEQNMLLSLRLIRMRIISLLIYNGLIMLKG